MPSAVLTSGSNPLARGPREVHSLVELTPNDGGVYGSSGSQVFTSGAASSVSQSATTIMDRFMQIPPTITIREGHRVKVYFTQDMLLPAYENHTIPQTF